MNITYRSKGFKKLKETWDLQNSNNNLTGVFTKTLSSMLPKINSSQNVDPPRVCNIFTVPHILADDTVLVPIPAYREVLHFNSKSLTVWSYLFFFLLASLVLLSS